MLESHLVLGLLETRQEAAQLKKRFLILSLCFVSVFTLVILLEVGLVHALTQLGLPLWAACFLLTTAQGAGTAYLFLKTGKRDESAGAPFQASREEYHRSLSWIQKRFF